MDMCFVREGLSESELNLPWSSAWLVFQYNMLILRVIYNGIIVYWAAWVVKGLKNKICCHTEKLFRGCDFQSIKLVVGWLSGG